jgi:YfiH family protein
MTELLVRSMSLRAAGFRHAFGIRTGGVSSTPFDSLNVGRAVGDEPAAVEENLRRFFAAAGIDRSTFVAVNQVHGDRVVAAADVGSPPPDADAIVAGPGASAGVRIADCVPVLIADRRTGAVAAAHAGWRGTIAKIVLRAVESMQTWHGTRSEDLLVAIGPRIGRCCFEVGEDLAERFAADASFGPEIVDRSHATPRVDLALANRKLLVSAGVPSEQIDTLDFCTSCRRDLFFSHRRDGGKTGRHLAVIAAGAKAETPATR